MSTFSETEFTHLHWENIFLLEQEEIESMDLRVTQWLAHCVGKVGGTGEHGKDAILTFEMPQATYLSLGSPRHRP